MTTERGAGHTKGPWLWRGGDGLYQPGSPPYTYGNPVLLPTWEYDSGVGIKCSEADAALIAAAPDLLAALEGMMQASARLRCEYNDMDRAAVIAVAAIARAKGEA